MNTNLAYDDWIEKARAELIDGETIMMSPRPAVNHNHVVLNISRIFSNYLYGKRCIPFSDGVDLYLDDNNRFVPDFMVVCDPNKIKPNGVYGAPDLVVEVLSPGTVRNDRTRKKDVYAQCGVREYWLVSPAEKTVEIFRLDSGNLVLRDIYALHPDWSLAQMNEDERAAVVTHFKCSLFDDLNISLEDIFYRTF